jgi:hypothetical protein
MHGTTPIPTESATTTRLSVDIELDRPIPTARATDAAARFAGPMAAFLRGRRVDPAYRNGWGDARVTDIHPASPKPPVPGGDPAKPALSALYPDTNTRLLTLADALALDEDALDDVVHDAASRLGSAANNGGLQGQIAFLFAHLGEQGVEAAIRSVAK